MDAEGHRTHFQVPDLPYKQPYCVNHPDRHAIALMKDGNHLCGACLEAKRKMNATDWDRYDADYPLGGEQPYKPVGGRLA